MSTELLRPEQDIAALRAGDDPERVVKLDALRRIWEHLETLELNGVGY